MRATIRTFSTRLKQGWSRFRTSRSEKRHSLVGPAHLWKMKRDFQIQFLQKAGLQPEHYLLDLGCGTLRGGIPIIEYLQVAHYYGIEVRPNVLDEAGKELRDARLEHKQPVLLLSENIETLDLKREFDFVWAFSVLIHMADDILDKQLAFVARHLKPTGHFYANVNIGTRADGSWQGFPVVSRSWDFYQQMGLRHGLRIDDLGPLESLGHAPPGRLAQDQRMLDFTKLDPSP